MEGKRYYFKGDLSQMNEAVRIAGKYGFEVKKSEDYRWYVCDENEYNLIVEKIVADRLQGYWHYSKFWKK